MRTFKDWESFSTEIRDSPSIDTKVNEIIELKGYFWPQFNLGKVPYDELHSLGYSLEDTLEKTFLASTIVGLESPELEDPDREGVVYNGLFLLLTKRGIIGYFDVIAGYPESPFSPPGNVMFSARLPVENQYRDSSVRFLQAIWPKVRGIGLAFPKEREANRMDIGNIALSNNGNLVATGYTAFQKIGLSLVPKGYLCAGHSYP